MRRGGREGRKERPSDMMHVRVAANAGDGLIVPAPPTVVVSAASALHGCCWC